MELRQLEYFVAVAEEQNFTRAAERVHISQSGVSAQIRQLERELGADLFDRGSRTVTLTVAGKAALEHARATLAAAAAVKRAADEVTGLISGSLTVGMVIGCTVTPLFDALATFHQAHPNVEISLLEDTSDRLADHRRVTLNKLTEHPIVCMPHGTGLRQVFDRVCAARDRHPVIAFQASAADAIADLAARGLGVGILSESMAEHYRDRLTARVIDDADQPATLALAWKNTRNPAVREALAHCRKAFYGRSSPAASSAITRST